MAFYHWALKWREEEEGGLFLMNIGDTPDLRGGVISSSSFLAFGALVSML